MNARVGWRIVVLAVSIAGGGCAIFQPPEIDSTSTIASNPAVAERVHPPTILPASAKQPAAMPEELTADYVIDQVLARNPTVSQMSAAMEAAAARYSQTTSLDDPSFTTWVAPASLGSNKVNDSARFEVSQKFPWPGKRELRGQSALALSAAAGHDLEDVRLQLVESARGAFADYYLAERGLEVNAEGTKLVGDFKREAEIRFQNAKAPVQDIRQADVEAGRLAERKLQLERQRQVAAARLNTLLNQPPGTPLPAPGKSLDKPETVPSAAFLQELALARRPDLQALAARLAADQAALGLAEREFYPDVEAMAAYDSFWQAADEQQRLRPQVGIRLNVPLRAQRRGGAVAEARAQIQRRRAELQQQMNQAAFEIEQAAAQLTESEKTLSLYEAQILPAARENVKAAQTAYATGQIPFLSLIEAQRSFVELTDRYYMSQAEYQQRRATLARVSGGPLPVPAK